MLRVARISIITALLTLLLGSQLASAETLVIDRTDSGWYDSIGIHDPTNPNYIVGDDRPDGFDGDFHNFFVFDLSEVTQQIASAKLALSFPSDGYDSPDASEDYELHDVVTPISSLSDGTGGVAAHTDLGSGVVYGSRTMTAADQGFVVEIPLNASAIAAMNSSHGLFAFGGSITTLDDLANRELAFGHSGNDQGTTELRFTLVPEPSTLFLPGIGAISLLGFRNSKSHG
jgi:large repetitive protein